MRQDWSDDRLDALSHRVDEGFHRVDKQFEQADTQLREMRAEMKRDFELMNARFDRFLLAIVGVGGGVIVTLMAALLTRA